MATVIRIFVVKVILSVIASRATVEPNVRRQQVSSTKTQQYDLQTSVETVTKITILEI